LAEPRADPEALSRGGEGTARPEWPKLEAGRAEAGVEFLGRGQPDPSPPSRISEGAL